VWGLFPTLLLPSSERIASSDAQHQKPTAIQSAVILKLTQATEITLLASS
jgi:hypothetical protein